MLGPALRLEGRTPLVASTTLAACSAIGYVFNLTTKPSKCEEQPSDLSPWRRSPHLDEGAEPRLYSPISPIRIFRPNPNLEIAFDVRTKNPVYVLERLDSDASSGWTGKRPRHHFYESQMLPEMYRSRNSSYHKSGYDRGHLAAAANYSTPSTILDTYNLCNVSPQDPRLNATAWSRLEEWTRRVAKKTSVQWKGSDTYVVTGPLWLPASRSQDDERRFEYRYPAVGIPPNLVAVPTHFFKLVVVVAAADASARRQSIQSEVKDSASKDQRRPIVVAYACFVVPNRDVLEDDKDWSIEDGLVAWTDLEAVSGLEFFTELVDRDWKIGADSAFVDSLRRRRKSKRIPMQHQLLLLESSDGNENTGIGAAKAKSTTTAAVAKKFKQSHGSSVSHLCPNGTCPRY